MITWQHLRMLRPSFAGGRWIVLSLLLQTGFLFVSDVKYKNTDHIELLHIPERCGGGFIITEKKPSTHIGQLTMMRFHGTKPMWRHDVSNMLTRRQHNGLRECLLFRAPLKNIVPPPFGVALEIRDGHIVSVEPDDYFIMPEDQLFRCIESVVKDQQVNAPGTTGRYALTMSVYPNPNHP